MGVFIHYQCKFTDGLETQKNTGHAAAAAGARQV